jgi:hypothetical protein
LPKTAVAAYQQLLDVLVPLGTIENARNDQSGKRYTATVSAGKFCRFCGDGWAIVPSIAQPGSRRYSDCSVLSRVVGTAALQDSLPVRWWLMLKNVRNDVPKYQHRYRYAQ